MKNLLLGNCLDRLKDLPDNSVDSVVTDPPYGLKFMSKKWDYEVPSVEIWKEVLRVLKPGGHLLSFGGTRTYHRMVVNIEDAGFEIRDQIQWLYGSGFPKSHNISKAIDKKLGAKRVEGKLIRTDNNIKGSSFNSDNSKKDRVEIRESFAATDLAKQWDGFGTALKPANEPICLARKPLSEKTIVDNVLKWGTGGINIDDCRVEADQALIDHSRKYSNYGESKGEKSYHGGVGGQFSDATKGRFPANVILDEEAGQVLDEQSGISKSTGGKTLGAAKGSIYGDYGKKLSTSAGGLGDKGGASRFFYCAKASKKERNLGVDNNNHPTVKPQKLMTYLCRPITPPNGTVLDPFMGSGSTGVAALSEGFDFVGVEMSEEYMKIAKERIENQEGSK